MIIVCLILSRQTEDLEALKTLTRVSQRVISKLDPGYLDPLGEGSFGQVFRAKKGIYFPYKPNKEYHLVREKFYSSRERSLFLGRQNTLK